MNVTRIVTGVSALRHAPVRPVVTVGVFDGVHVAHQQLIRSTNALAQRLQGTSVVITFDPDPQLVLHPSHASLALMPLHERLQHLRTLGAGLIWVIPFTRRFAHMTAEQFVRTILRDRLRAVALVVGEGFAFGRNRRGDMRLLRTLGPRCGVRIVSVPPIWREGAPVSSSRIRRLVAQGQLSRAKKLLSRPPMLHGTVVRGAGRGRRLGFPTANIQLTDQVLPPTGVYAVLVRIPGLSRSRRGLMNLGIRPTFGSGPLVCEVHLLGFSGRLRGKSVSIALVARLRSERCFKSPAALAQQIHRDLLRAQRLFTT